MQKAKDVNEYIEIHAKDAEILKVVRDLAINCGLEECIKWGAPTYTYKKKNLIGLVAFKNYVGLWFYEGALLSDFASKLLNAQEGKTKALRQWRMSSVEEVDAATIRAYIIESMDNVDKGKKIVFEKKEGLTVPAELINALNGELEQAFNQMTTAKKREYAECVSSAKREETKLKRIEKIIPLIKEGVGLMDKYKK